MKMTAYFSALTGRALKPLFTLALMLALLGDLFAQVSVPYIASGTFTPPTGVTSVTVECWGGGGHGGTRTSDGVGGGGGGGAYARSTLTVVPGTPYTVTVGAGSSSAAAGGDSWFSTTGTILAKGGGSVANNSATGAAGGLASASIGTFKFNGGTGATGLGNSGGGGSSAGTALAGSNGTVIAGGVAPAGGGDGGDGVTGTDANGNDGSFPGGAGAGAKRNTGTRNGGDGANGYVLVSYSYAIGTCLNAVAGTEFKDNACGAGSLTVTIPVSGQPTTLGTAAGNAKLNSLGLIISHAFNADLDITLTSPSGVTRNLILDRFNAGDNLGNPGSCPGGALILQDGGTALNNTTTNNVTGTYAPEQTLDGFTGNPNGNWVLTICDDAANDLGNFRYFNMDFCTVPTTATVGSAQTICASGTTVALGGNTPGFGTGAWSIVSGGTGTFSNAASGSSTFTHTGGVGPVVLRWTISNGTCASSTANVSVTISQPPTTATVGGSQTICANATTTALGGNTPSAGTGAWSVVSGGAGTFSNAASGSSTFTHTSGVGPVVLRWTISSNPCTASTADVSITITPAPTTATVGSAQTICTLGTTAALGGNTPVVGTGAWSIVSGGAGTFSNSASGSSTFTHTSGAGPVVLRWTITSAAPCVASTANVTITISPNPTTATVGGTQTICATGTTTSLGGNTPGSGTGAWSVVSGGAGTFSNAASGSSTFTHTSGAGPVVLRWTISSNPCTASSATVTINITPATTVSDAGPDQSVCANATATLAANVPANGTGAWSVVSGPSTSNAQFSSLSLNNAVFTPAIAAGTYTLRWTISNSPCTSSTDDVVITMTPQPAVPTMTPTSASICQGGSTGLSASAPNVTTSVTGGAITLNFNNTASPYPSAVTVSSLPVSGVTVTSVSINGVTHNNPDDIDMVLRSPTGTYVVLMSDAGGTGNISGNNYVIQDGAAAMSDNGTNASGTYAPTNIGATDGFPAPVGSLTQATPLLSSFSGDFNGTWNLYIDGDNSNGAGALTSWSITFSVPVNYAWTPATGLNVTNVASVTASPTSTTTYTVTVTNPVTGCYNSNTVAVNVTNPPTTATVGGAQTICSSGTSAGLGGNTPSVGTGAWSVVSGGTGTFSNAATPNATFTHTGGAGPVIVRWTISNAPCTASAADVSITITPAPSATISYGGLPHCQGGGVSNVSRTGTAGGTYSAPAGLTIDASTGTVTPSTSTVGSYLVTYTIAASGGCSQFATTANYTVSATPIRYRDIDGDGAGDPNDFVASCGSLIGYVNNSNDLCPLDPLKIVPGICGCGSPDVDTDGDGLLDCLDNCPNIAGQIGSVCDDANANTINDVITAGCVCAGTNAIWYSQGNGTFADPIWSQNINGPGAAATLNAGSIVVIKTGHTVTAASAQALLELTVQSGATLSLGAQTLTIHGAAVQVNGTVGGGTGTLVLQPSAAATISGTGTLNMFNVTVNAPAGLACNATLYIRGTLQLDNGVFTAGGYVQLTSNATGTGRLGTVAPTASYVGNLTVNRYIPAGATNWRFLGSPVSGQTVYHWKDDFYTAGFPGSHAPGFSNPTGSGILWPSVRWYDETNTGSNINDGLVGATGITQPLARGQGFSAWSGTGLTTTTAFTVDVTGNPYVANTPIALPMTYTNTGVAAVDGWNLVSNPVASPIAFDQIARGADVADYVTFFNPAMGNNATWDISLGLGTNGGSNTIQSSQGFWLKANGPAVSTTVSESAKVSGNGGGFFGDEENVANVLRLNLSSTVNTFFDETLIVFSEGQPATTADDVPKYVFAHPEAPQLATQGDGGQMIAINVYGPYSTDITIPVLVDVAVSGTYTITATGLENVGLSCLSIEDVVTGNITPLTEGAAYSFAMDASADASVPRLLLHGSAPLVFQANDVLCANDASGAASIEVTNGPVDITWSDDQGNVLLQQSDVPAGMATNDALIAGDYVVTVNSNSGCAAMTQAFHIDQPFAMEVSAQATAASCPEAQDGAVDVQVLGGNAPYTYQWSNNSTSEDLVAAAGEYSVTVTDANGCELTSTPYTITAGQGPVAEAAVASNNVPVNTPVLFSNNSQLGTSYLWDFADGSTSTAFEPEHTFVLPGTYSVMLTVFGEACNATTTVVINVETTTGIVTHVGPSLNAWVSGDVFVVEHTENGGKAVTIDVMNAAGQVVMQRQMAGTPGRITLPTAGLATGIWFLRVTTSQQQRTFSLPVVR